MAGTKKQAASTKRNQGEDFYARIGARGGAAKTRRTKKRGMASLPAGKAAELGRLGAQARWSKRATD